MGKLSSKYTKELLEPLVKESYTIREVMMKLGLKTFKGNMPNYISKKIIEHKIDTSHFKWGRKKRLT